VQSLTPKIWQRTEVAILVACILMSLVLMILPGAWKQAIGRAVVGTVFYPLEKPLTQLRSLVASHRENRELRRELAELKMENAALRESGRENLEMRQLLGLKQRWQWRYVAAELVARDPGIFVSNVLIDKGRRDSLQKGQVAISTMGLVGLVDWADDGSAAVKTVFHPEVKVSALDLRSRVLGILRFQAERGLILDRVPIRSDVLPGDSLITSGYGGLFPPGLMLGVVDEVRPDSLRLHMNIKVKPALDLNRLSQLFVITGGQPPPLPGLFAGPADTAGPKIRTPRLGPIKPSLSIRPAQPRIVEPISPTSPPGEEP